MAEQVFPLEMRSGVLTLGDQSIYGDEHPLLDEQLPAAAKLVAKKVSVDGKTKSLKVYQLLNAFFIRERDVP